MTWDRQRLKKEVTQYFPIFASILTFVTGSIALADASNSLVGFLINLCIAIASSLFITFSVYIWVRKKSFSRRREDYEIREIHDIIKIHDIEGKKSTWKRSIKFVVKKRMEHFEMVMPSTSGKFENERAFEGDHERSELDTWIVPFRPEQHIKVDKPYEPNDASVHSLVIKWDVINGFISDKECVRLMSQPGLEGCTISIILPSDSPPPDPAWKVDYSRRNSWKDKGNLDPIETAEGEIRFSHDFSPELEESEELQLAVFWNKHPADVETNSHDPDDELAKVDTD